jgi:hypothetical protein
MAALQAIPGTVQFLSSCVVLFSGPPNRAITWELTGTGSLSYAANRTGPNGQATAKYTPSTDNGVAVVTVTYGT